MRAAILPLLLLVTACSGEQAAEPAPTPTATVAAPRTLVAADFDPAMLGAHVPGMDIEEAETNGSLARVSGFVACAKDMTVCDPATAPDGAIYTYVLTLTPAPVPEPAPSPTATTTTDLAAPAEAPAELVRTTRVVPGFNGAVGFSRTEATAALGAEDALGITLDQNQLIWRVTGGSGWQAGKPITLWWQSTRAPARPSPAYRLEYAGKSAVVSAPFPAADKVGNR